MNSNSTLFWPWNRWPFTACLYVAMCSHFSHIYLPLCSGLFMDTDGMKGWSVLESSHGLKSALWRRDPVSVAFNRDTHSLWSWRVYRTISGSYVWSPRRPSPSSFGMFMFINVVLSITMMINQNRFRTLISRWWHHLRAFLNVQYFWNIDVLILFPFHCVVHSLYLHLHVTVFRTMSLIYLGPCRMISICELCIKLSTCFVVVSYFKWWEYLRTLPWVNLMINMNLLRVYWILL